MTTNPIHCPALSLIRVRAQVRAARPLTLQQRDKARQEQLSFDFDAAWDALPPPVACPAPAVRVKGAAGHRLRADLRASWPEPLLKEFARETLGAVRIRSGYLDALRVVLGNQAHAERHGYTLEQNIRVDFATERVMRTINEQMHAAGITQDRTVGLGVGRVQSVRCFVPGRRSRTEDLCTVMRREEEATEARWTQGPPMATVPACITADDVPY